jgi:hypothetical protein
MSSPRAGRIDAVEHSQKAATGGLRTAVVGVQRSIATCSSSTLPKAQHGAFEGRLLGVLLRGDIRRRL